MTRNHDHAATRREVRRKLRHENRILHKEVGPKLPTVTSKTMNPELEHLMGNLAREKGDFNATGAPRRGKR